MALVSTISGSTSNSYDSVANADVYFADRMNADAWTGSDKDKALITATSRLEAIDYLGSRSVTGQALKHPRTGLFVDGLEVAANKIAPPILAAMFELALELKKGNSSATGANDLSGFKKLQIGPLTIEPNQPAATTDIDALIFQNLGDLPPHVFWLIKDLVTEGAGGGLDSQPTHFTLACGNRGR